MRWKIFFSILFFLVAFFLFMFYWFAPFRTLEFSVSSGNSNFSVDGTGGMQFYPNMRYSDPDISYKIDGCTLQKKNDMERAFEIIANKSVLSFYSVQDEEEISITCDSQTKMEGSLFIAGEGGPTNVTEAGVFYVILHGDILLLRDSRCETPNIAIHELLHTLGFNHSENPNNVMYPVSKCGQIIGDDVFNLINELYLLPSYCDLVVEDASAIVRGRYLDANITIKNNGFKNSEKSRVVISADGEVLKDFEVDELGVGYGRKIILGNIWVPKSNINKLEISIEYNLSELEKKNNKIILEIKK